MNIEVNLNNLTEAEQVQLNALVAKANRSKKVWKPMNDEMYFFINPDNPSGVDYCYCTESDFDERVYAVGNCFQTKEAIEFALEKLKVIAEMKKYIVEHDDVDLDWNNCEQEKWYIKYYHDTDDIDADYNMCTQIVDNSLYASSSEILEAMIEEIGQDRIKRYYFGVV